MGLIETIGRNIVMRIGTGAFFHETNSFSNILVTQERLATRWAEGERIFKAYTGIKDYMGGFIDEAGAQNAELIPSVFARYCPCGPTEKKAIENVRDRIVEMLTAAHAEKPLDAIALHLHGAGVAEGYPDVDGEIIRAVRQAFGPDMPIGVVLDLHGNITDTMMEHSDLLIGIKTYPHVDEYTAARIMFSRLCHMARSGYKVYKKMVRLPWHIAPAEGLTTAGPAHDVQQLLYKLEETEENLIQASFFQGFPYSDIKECGVSVVTMALDQETADRTAMEIARYAWSRRKDFAVPIHSAAQAFDLALAIPDGPGPVVINESSDNTGGGTPGDGTHLLREMLKRNLPGTAFGFIYDPEVAQLAAKAGIGGKISCKLGGKMDNLHGEPIELKDAYVRCLSDGVYVNQSPKGGGNTVRLGMSACLAVGNVDVVVSSERVQATDDGVFRMVGISKDLYQIVAVKSSQHFKAWWENRCRGMVPCETPGIQCADLTVFDFKNADPNYYPLKDAIWEE